MSTSSPLNLNVVQGRTATYTVVLATQPTSEVIVTPSVGQHGW